MKVKILKQLILILMVSTLAFAMSDEEKSIAANLDFFLEYEMIERDDFQEVYGDLRKKELKKLKKKNKPKKNVDQ